jgi:hypothetical protein
MPAEVTTGPLGIACVFSDGTSARFDLEGLPCPELARDLLAGLAELVHPHGTVDSPGSVGHYAQSVRHMARHLAASGFTGGAAGLRRAQVAQYWVASSGTWDSRPPAAPWTPGWPSSLPGGPTIPSAAITSSRRIPRPSGSAWPAPAG